MYTTRLVSLLLSLLLLVHTSQPTSCVQCNSMQHEQLAGITGRLDLASAPATPMPPSHWQDNLAGLQSSPNKMSMSAEALPSSTCHLQGTVDDCCNCTYQSVEDINDQFVQPILASLVETAFFRYFKVNIYCDCPLWPDDSMCMMQACSVCECDPGEVPQPWVTAEEQSCAAARSSAENCSSLTCTAELDSLVDRGLEPGMQAKLLNLRGWRGYNNPWMAGGEHEEEYLYINLITNPERYTGYQGEHAHRIWSSIYDQPCLSDGAMAEGDEQRVFYRLISGMHASISVHLTQKYLLDEMLGVWGPNLPEFERRLGNTGVRERVENLYFAYLFVLRAVMKAGPLLEKFSYYTGVQAEDDLAARLMKNLVRDKALKASCPIPFDEGRLWKGRDGHLLKQELQQAFQNITRIMDCVGCEKCKLWGKLQTLGVATALKILFSSADCDGQLPGSSSPFQGSLELERNEVIALLNLLERFSSSISYYHSMSKALQNSRPSIRPALSMSEPVS